MTDPFEALRRANQELRSAAGPLRRQISRRVRARIGGPSGAWAGLGELRDAMRASGAGAVIQGVWAKAAGRGLRGGWWVALQGMARRALASLMRLSTAVRAFLSGPLLRELSARARGGR